MIYLFVAVCLAACGQAAVSGTPTATETAAVPSSTATATRPSDTPTRRPPTSTPTPVPCDPTRVDFCIEDGYFVFHPPFVPPAVDAVDRGYPYGSTQGGRREAHHGVEFENRAKTPVLAAADGVVYYAGNDATRLFTVSPNYYGNLVVLRHELSDAPYQTLYTLYAHLSKIEVAAGQSVTAGQEIGQVGMTGAALGNHLHFEVRLDPQDSSSTLNPELWLTPHPGNGTLVLRAVDTDGKRIAPQYNIQYFPDPKLPAAVSYAPEVYAAETVNPRDIWNEVAAIGDLPAGRYRVVVMWLGKFYTKWVDVVDGKLTLVAFVGQ